MMNITLVTPPHYIMTNDVRSVPTIIIQCSNCRVKISFYSYLACSSIEAWVRVTFIHIHLTVLARVPSITVTAIVIDQVLRV